MTFNSIFRQKTCLESSKASVWKCSSQLAMHILSVHVISCWNAHLQRLLYLFQMFLKTITIIKTMLSHKNQTNWKMIVERLLNVNFFMSSTVPLLCLHTITIHVHIYYALIFASYSFSLPPFSIFVFYFHTFFFFFLLFVIVYLY